MKKKWYDIYLANNDVIRAYRTMVDRIWRSDKTGIMVFHTEDDKTIRVSTHWIIKIVEV